MSYSYRIEQAIKAASVLHKDQVRYDPDMHGHYHFVCRQCQEVFDVPQMETRLEAERFQEATKHRVEQVSLVLSGCCESCQ